MKRVGPVLLRFSIPAGTSNPLSPESRSKRTRISGLVTTMNDDASTFDLPEYIHSRLQPQILIDFPEREEELAILRENLPFAPDEVLQYVTDFLQQAHAADESYTVRDGLNIARYLLKLAHGTGKFSPGPFPAGCTRRFGRGSATVQFPPLSRRQSYVQRATERRNPRPRESDLSSRRAGAHRICTPGASVPARKPSRSGGGRTAWSASNRLYRKAIDRMPQWSVAVIHSDDDEESAQYIPIEPGDPFTEALRTAAELGAETIFLEPTVRAGSANPG